MSAAYTTNPADLIEAMIDGLRARGVALEKKLDELRADNAYLRKENEQLWESIAERDNHIRELQEMNLRAQGDDDDHR